MSTAGLRALQANTERMPIVPSPSTPQGGRRRYVQTGLLVSNLQAGTFTDVNARFTLDIPSCRLHTKVTVAFRPENAESTSFPQSGPTAWLLTLDAWDRTEDGLLVLSNNIITNVALPASYEAVTAVDQWRGTVTVPNTGPGTGIVPGKLFVTACWEPAAGYNASDVELAHIFQACHLTVSQGLTTYLGSE